MLINEWTIPGGIPSPASNQLKKPSGLGPTADLLFFDAQRKAGKRNSLGFWRLIAEGLFS
jgi:hypothetical protein